MFPLRRTPKEPEIDWPALLGLLEDDDRRAAVARLAPVPGRESYLMALRRMQSPVATETLTAGRRLDTAARLVDRPTLAVAGMLNSGKTSLVSSFLSPAGQQRTLRGTSNREGTHRFVLWLPESWRSDVELWSLLVSRIGDSLGQPPENLAEDPVEAAAQYNNRSGEESQLAVALLATDPGLDEVGVGLLDCPDIVSDEELGLGSPQRRKELLGRAATLCSAFLIVSDAASSRDTTLADLMRIAADLMPGVPRMLAVNKVRPRQTPDQIFETFSPLCKKNGVSSIYAAYDYDVPASRPFIPQQNDDDDGGRGSPSRDNAVAVGLAGSSLDDNEPLPVFFEVASNPDENPPASIDDERFLKSLPQRLDRGVLFSQLHRALRINLEKIVWDQGLESIRENAEASFVKTQQCQRVLLDASLEFFANHNMSGEVSELRLHQSERIVRQLSESFAATAPWYARWGVRLNATIRNFVGGAGDLIRSLTPSALSQRAADDIKGRFRSGEYGGLIAPERLLAEIGRQGGTVVLSHYRDQHADSETPPRQAGDVVTGAEPADDRSPAAVRPRATDRGKEDSRGDDELLLAPIERAVTRFEQDDFTTLDPRRLDDAIRQMWSEIPMHKKLAHGLTPLATILAAFGAALMVPIDFGHSFVLAASIPELFAAAGLGALAAMWAGNQGAREVGQQAARQQLADFLAVLCDELGIARPDPPMKVRVAGNDVTLPPSRITRSETSGPSMPVYRVRDEFVGELQKLIPRSAESTK
ncbi:hypothetical protein [Allorhodopirellula solitaria]|uniref:Dynamin family protein n=1 Tax=Allorhodopirellula solitaria TaxID=2527987 RepID=A0A5C5YJ96_9BACT|nr:hypothetical protein [Allorhodopirellula solitaria]TWT74942.1 hypothetical protein CA85_02300 [Allorhodopirellula solitaria]